MLKDKRISIRSQLLLLLATVTLPLMGLIFFSAYLDIQRANQSAYDTAGGLSNLTAAHVEQLFNDSHRLLSEIAERPQVRALDQEQCDPFLQEIPQLFIEYAGITLANSAGEIYCTAVSPDATPDVQTRTSFADRPWFQEVIRTEQFTVSEALVSRIHGRWVTVLAYPVYDLDGRLGGVLTVSINLVRYQASLERLSLPTASTITIIDGQGKVVARSEEAAGFVGQDGSRHEIVSLVQTENIHLARARGLDGREKFFGITPVRGTDWKVYSGIPVEVAYAPVQNNLIQLAEVAILIILTVSLMALYLMGEIEKPAKALAQVAVDVAAGQVDRRAPTDGPAEFRLVALQFNRMLAANSRHRTELERYAQQLKEANEELESFAYSVSHDLRAPLRAMSGFSRLLGEEYGKQLDETGQHYLRRIETASKFMGQLIDDLLKLSRLSRSDMVCVPVDLSEMTHQVVEELRQRYPERAVKFTIMEQCQAMGDPPLLRIALANLLDNAWKFTAKVEQPLVEFGCSAAPSGQKIYYVCDNGAGFDMAYADKLFGAFQRLHTEKEFPGTGIGLATVQRAIRRHGGEVWAEAAVDQGATFFFTLEG
jgi:signal transduction histidine kinase